MYVWTTGRILSVLKIAEASHAKAHQGREGMSVKVELPIEQAIFTIYVAEMTKRNDPQVAIKTEILRLILFKANDEQVAAVASLLQGAGHTKE